MTGIYDLLHEDPALRGLDQAYIEKQLHKVPEWPVVSRVDFILDRCKGQRVLNLGSASGALHEAMRQVATSVIGVDCEPGSQTDVCLDLDDYDAVQAWVLPSADLIVAGEILEHSGMPFSWLRKLKTAQVPMVLSTPNAFAAAGQAWLRKGWINVNAQHTGWYCPKTLETLLARAGWTIQEGAWYGGQAKFSEGIIVVAT